MCPVASRISFSAVPTARDYSRTKLCLTSGGLPYAEVIARSPGLAMRSELPWVQVPCLFYAVSVVANPFPVGNNPVGVAYFLERP